MCCIFFRLVNKHCSNSCSFLSGPSHVVVVMDWLESVTEYMRLGLELGLSYTLLNKIRQEQGRKVEDCKRTLLHSWLKGTDRVVEMGGINKSALVAALRRMGEHRVANSIISGLRCDWSNLMKPYSISFAPLPICHPYSSMYERFVICSG